MKTYDNAISLTSQIFFCSTPFRLDSYNRCQFGCIYCFSSRRSVENSKGGLRTANIGALSARFDRVRSGVINSAIDEFINKRIPIQFGGINDPFSAVESRKGTSFRALAVLRDNSYPTLISTKSAIPFQDDYLSVLAEMNVSLRVSAAGVNEKSRSLIDRDCPNFFEMLGNIERASKRGIATTLRIQPIIPSQEAEVLRMIEAAADAGVRHVSLEYLKIPLEIRADLIRKLSSALNLDMHAMLEKIGLFRVGPDMTLMTEYKLNHMRAFRELLHSLGMSFGAGDTELIHLSDGPGCCNGSGLLLQDANVLDSNFTGILKRGSGKITFSSVMSKWTPSKLVNPYLVVGSRKKAEIEGLSDWQALMAYRWNRSRSIYSPALFAGVSSTGSFDADGLEVYRYDHPWKDIS